MPHYGDSGIAINRDNFDLQLDAGGDVAVTEDENELVKDLALQIRLFFKNNIKGEVITDTQTRTIETQVRDIVASDDRIESVTNVTVDQRGRQDQPAVEISARSIYDFEQFRVDPTTL